MTTALNWNSNQLTRGWQRGIRAFYYGLGFDEEDFDRPQIGIGVPLLEGNTCNVHAYELAGELQKGCTEAGMLAFPFGTPAVSDNLSQGHEGGNASLPSHNLIATLTPAGSRRTCPSMMKSKSVPVWSDVRSRWRASTRTPVGCSCAPRVWDRCSSPRARAVRLPRA